MESLYYTESLLNFKLIFSFSWQEVLKTMILAFEEKF